MKYIVTYSAKRKNAKRHVCHMYGKIEYFNTIEDAQNRASHIHPDYIVEILTSKYEKVGK